jgi:polysaccharide export outer membrane protein
MNLRIIKIFLIFAIFLSVQAFAQEKEKREAQYRIAINDLLEISVYDEPDMDKTVRVAPDGSISYQLLGRIPAVGLTAEELKERITKLLEEDYLYDPKVNVFIKEHAKVFVSGEVVKPGAYELKAGLTLMEVITLAGGFTDKADLSKVKLSRIVEGKKKTIIIDANDISEVANKDKDMFLGPNDEIIVEELGTVSVIGQVKSPGKYNLKKDTDVLEVIAFAGGFTDKADQEKIKLVRERNGKKETIFIDANKISTEADENKTIFMEPGDIIVVEELGTVSVIGQVKSPGKYNLRKDMTALDAIAIAGGLTDMAAANETKVIRKTRETEEMIRVPINNILRSGDRSRDVILQPGDTIVIPESLL